MRGLLGHSCLQGISVLPELKYSATFTYAANPQGCLLPVGNGLFWVVDAWTIASGELNRKMCSQCMQVRYSYEAWYITPLSMS